jgi:hypothetical protein
MSTQTQTQSSGIDYEAVRRFLAEAAATRPAPLTVAEHDRLIIERARRFTR